MRLMCVHEWNILSKLILQLYTRFIKRQNPWDGCISFFNNIIQEKNSKFPVDG